MYRPIVRLNTNVCKICKRNFNNEKSLKFVEEKINKISAIIKREISKGKLIQI